MEVIATVDVSKRPLRSASCELHCVLLAVISPKRAIAKRTAEEESPAWVIYFTSPHRLAPHH
jgi:hypothetical protein